MKRASVKGFFAFCKNNLIMISAVTVTLFFSYGIKLFRHSIGLNTEIFINNRNILYDWSISIGRFGMVCLSKLLVGKLFNPYATFLTTFCLTWFFTMSWCYIIAIFGNNTGKNNRLIPFALIFISMPVWAEQFYFVYQSIEIALMVGLCPYIIYLFYKGFIGRGGGKIKVTIAFIMLVFMISVYQPLVIIFCCGALVCFLLLLENSDYEHWAHRNLLIKLLTATVGALVCYSVINRLVLVVLRIEKSGYLDNFNLWWQRPFKEIVFNILLFCYNVTIGHIQWVTDIWKNQYLANYSRIWGNALLLPVAIAFLIKIIYAMRNKIPTGRRLLYLISGIGIPLSIILLTIILGGNTPPLRAIFALPLAFAFMFFYIMETSNKKIVVITAGIALIVAFYQAQTTAQLLYTDYIRYNDDVNVAYNLEELIEQVQPLNPFEQLPVVFIGYYQTASKFHTNFLSGDAIGLSFFGPNSWGEKHNSLRALYFMATLGINYAMPNTDQIDRALKEATLMSSYPDPGCVRNFNDYILVKLPEDDLDSAGIESSYRIFF